MLRIRILRPALSLAACLIFASVAHAQQQFTVTNGTTQTAAGPAYAAIANASTGSALYAINNGSRINGSNLTLTSNFAAGTAFTRAPAARSA